MNEFFLCRSGCIGLIVCLRAQQTNVCSKCVAKHSQVSRAPRILDSRTTLIHRHTYATPPQPSPRQTLVVYIDFWRPTKQRTEQLQFNLSHSQHRLAQAHDDHEFNTNERKTRLQYLRLGQYIYKIDHIARKYRERDSRASPSVVVSVRGERTQCLSWMCGIEMRGLAG